MPTSSPVLPDLSADFMTWLNAELRKRVEEPEAMEDEEETDNVGLVNRLKSYLTGALSVVVSLALPFALF